MGTYEFTVVARISEPFGEGVIGALYEAGCDDGTVAFQKGRILVDFSREARDVGSAIASALSDVAKAGVVAIRVEPDHLVTMSEIARRSGVSRQSVSHYADGERGERFPPPVACVTTERPLWDWAAVARWFHDAERLTDEVLDHAEAVRAANLAIEAAKLPKVS